MPRRILLTGAAAAVGLLAAAQLLRPEMSNPQADPARCLWNDTRVDPKVATVLRRACADCHSHETVWPWYSHLSPVNWLIARDVAKGRRKLNFSQWKGGSQNVWEEIVDALDKGNMPPRQYVWMHPEARLSEAEIKLIESWVDGGMQAARP